jgi:unsaturated chondroitin disaccharide hydrolase
VKKIELKLKDEKESERNSKQKKGCGFVVKHSVVSKPHDKGVDVHLNYADYYFLEASLRYLNLQPVDEK